MIQIVPCEHCGSLAGMDLKRRCIACFKHRPPSAGESLKAAAEAWRALSYEQRGFIWTVFNVTAGGHNCTDEQREIIEAARAVLAAAEKIS